MTFPSATVNVDVANKWRVRELVVSLELEPAKSCECLTSLASSGVGFPRVSGLM